MQSNFNELKNEKFSSNDSEYDLTVYKSQSSGEIRINISKDGEEKSTLWSLKDLEISPEVKDENELIEKCLSLAKSAIQENESED